MSNFKIFKTSIYQIKVLKHIGETTEKKKILISIATQTEYQEPEQKIYQEPEQKIDNKPVHKQYDKLLYLSYSTIILLNIYTLSKVYYIENNNHNKSITQNPLILTMNFIYKLFKNF